MAGMTTVEAGGTGWLRTKPIVLAGAALKLRIAGEATAEVEVHVLASAGGELLASGTAKSTMAESSSGTSEEVVVAWSDKMADTALAAAVGHNESVVVEMHCRGGASMFSFVYE